jgi:predicted nucleotidyltransferase
MSSRKIKNTNNNDLDFWNTWNNVLEIEKSAIASTKIAKEMVIKSVTKDVLVAIYIKGSFTRREMNENSDVDMVPIVTKSEFESEVFEVNNLKIEPVMVVPLSIEEFKSNQLATKSDQSVDLRARPDRFLRMIDEYKLIYGKPLNPNDYPIRTDQEVLKDEIEIIKSGYIPLFLKGEIDFAPLLKEFFWMTEMELSSIGIKVPHTFVGIANGANKDHLIQEALKLRQQRLLNKTDEIQFVSKLQNWLEIKIGSNFA